MGYRSAGRMLALSMTVLSPLCAQPVQAQDAISVMSFGGAYQEAQRKAVFETYTASTGIKVDEQEYGGEIAKIKAMIESGNTTVDAVDVDAPTLLQGCDEGIFEKIDWAKIGPEDAKNLPTSPQNLTVSLTLDNGFWADNGEEIRKRFTTWLAQ